MQGVLCAQFSTERGIGSSLIRWASAGRFSHVDLVVAGGLLGARLDGGVRVRPMGYAKFTDISRVSVPVPDIRGAIDFAYDQIGKPYAKGAIVDIILHRERPFSMDQKSWFCDELLYATVMAGGVELLNTSNPFWLTPWEVYLSPLWRQGGNNAEQTRTGVQIGGADGGAASSS